MSDNVFWELIIYGNSPKALSPCVGLNSVDVYDLEKSWLQLPLTFQLLIGNSTLVIYIF